jgi:hypothetical protein
MKKIPLLFILLISISSFSQDNNTFEYPKNVIHGSLGSIGYSNSLQFSYDRLIKQSNDGFFKAYYATIKAGGLVGLDFSGNDSGTGNVISIGATALTGRGRHHFEAGLGLGYFIDTENVISASNPFGSSDESTFYPSATLGYRIQTSKGFMFRTGFGSVEWAYFGFGFSF